MDDDKKMKVVFSKDAIKDLEELEKYEPEILKFTKKGLFLIQGEKILSIKKDEHLLWALRKDFIIEEGVLFRHVLEFIRDTPFLCDFFSKYSHCSSLPLWLAQIDEPMPENLKKRLDSFKKKEDNSKPQSVKIGWWGLKDRFGFDFHVECCVSMSDGDRHTVGGTHLSHCIDLPVEVSSDFKSYGINESKGEYSFGEHAITLFDFFDAIVYEIGEFGSPEEAEEMMNRFSDLAERSKDEECVPAEEVFKMLKGESKEEE